MKYTKKNYSLHRNVDGKKKYIFFAHLLCYRDQASIHTRNLRDVDSWSLNELNIR